VQPTARRNKKGFTFVEVLVALTILMVSMLGIIEAMVMAMQQNLENYSRDEAVRIAEQTMNELRDSSFDGLNNATYPPVSRKYKQFTRTFNVNRTVTALSSDSRSVELQVSWTINGKTHNHSITSLISRGI
jgi:prepilin-type N-terminal cleavage/methylation domain-containing protein